MYEGFNEEFSGQQFDLICIDGPNGSEGEYSRADIVGILPECLEARFVILLDDCDRPGETNTLNLLSAILKDCGIDHSVGGYYGQKGTGIITSKDLSFLCTL